MTQSFTRRDFMASMLAAGFALAVQPVCADTAVRTSEVGLLAGEIQVPVAGGVLPAYRAQPEGAGPFPTVLVVQEIFGVHEYIRDVCRRLAQLGYQAIAPELFFRHGDVTRLKSVQEILSTVVAKVPDGQVLADLDACAAWAQAHGGDSRRVGITGFCWGGRISWLYAAQRPQLKAAVAWYGRLDGLSNELTPSYPLDVAGQIQVPVLGLYGGQDQNIPLADVERMQALLDQGRSGSRIHVYADAPHAFHADYRPSYRAAAAADGWQRLQQWFKAQGL